MREAGFTLARLVGFAIYMVGAGCWSLLFFIVFGRI